MQNVLLYFKGTQCKNEGLNEKSKKTCTHAIERCYGQKIQRLALKALGALGFGV